MIDQFWEIYLPLPRQSGLSSTTCNSNFKQSPSSSIIGSWYTHNFICVCKACHLCHCHFLEMDLLLRPYLRHPDVSRWLFSTEPVTCVTPQQLSWSFVYSIAMGTTQVSVNKPLHIEDVVIPISTSGYFILGFVRGLGQPHLFSRTSLMYKRTPVSRRFAINTASTDAVEFVEFDIFEDGKILIIFRRFLHTRDGSLPCRLYTSLHAPSSIPYTLGSIVMRADIIESSSCPTCCNFTTNCICNYSTDLAPYAPVERRISNWDHYKHHMVLKDKVGTARLRMSTVNPGGDEVTIASMQFDIVNLISAGNTPYLNILRRRVIHEMGLNVVIPRADAHIIPIADANDFNNLHRHYMSKKRLRTGVQVLHRNLGSIGDDAFEDVTPEEMNVHQRKTHTSIANQSDPESNSKGGDDIFGLLSTYFSMTANTFAGDCAGAGPRIENAATHDHSQPDNLKDRDEPEILDVTSVGPRSSSSRLFSSLRSATFDTSTISAPPIAVNPLTPRSTEQRDTILKDLEDMLSPPSSGPETLNSTPARSSSSACSSTIKSVDDGPTEGIAQNGKESSSGSRSDDVIPSFNSNAGDETDQPNQRRVRQCCEQPGTEDSGEDNDESRKHCCKLCSSKFKMRGDLQRHVKIVHERQKLYSCSTCGKSFGHSGHLNRHVNSVHLQRRRFKCPLCGFQFFQASHLQSHMNHVHGEKKSIECEHCGVRVKSQSAMRYHLTVCSTLNTGISSGKGTMNSGECGEVASNRLWSYCDRLVEDGSPLVPFLMLIGWRGQLCRNPMHHAVCVRWFYARTRPSWQPFANRFEIQCGTFFLLSNMIGSSILLVPNLLTSPQYTKCKSILFNCFLFTSCEGPFFMW